MQKMHRYCPRLASVVRFGVDFGCCGLVIVMGCNSDPRGKLYPVSGKITLADGKLLPPNGRVVFVPIQDDPNAPALANSVGPVGEDGSYTLSTNGKPGAPRGKYRVGLADGKRGNKAWSVVPRKYMVKSKENPLEVEVEANKPEGGYDFQLKP
jgi:hypothetical protein